MNNDLISNMNTKSCPKCNTENPQQANYCRHCGTKFEEKPQIQSSGPSWSKDGKQFDIKYKVKKIIADKLGVEMSEVTDNANFALDLNADSLDTVELIMEVEKEFGISVPDEDLKKIYTVKDIIDYVQKNH